MTMALRDTFQRGKGMKKLLALFLLLASPAFAQGNSVKQSGHVTPGHVPMWTTNGVIGDGGTAVNGFLTSIGVVAVGPGICQTSGPITGPYQQICLGVTATGGQITFGNFGGAPVGNLVATINGNNYSFPFTPPATAVQGPISTTAGHFPCWNNNTGTLLSDCTTNGPTLSQILVGASSSSSTWTTATSWFDAAFCNTPNSAVQRSATAWVCAGIRPVLTGSPIFYVSTTGSDITGDGSLAKPYATAATAIFNLLTTYDFGNTVPVIQYEDGTYDLSAGGGLFWQSPFTGAGYLTLQGNASNPSAVVLDGGSSGLGNQAIFAGPGAGGTLQVQNIKLQNFAEAFNCELNSANISIIGPIVFGAGNNIDFDIEFCGPGGITSGSPATITFTGAQNQLMYVEGTGHADFNQAQIIFSGGTTFNTLYNVAFGGMIRIYNNFTGTTTGIQYDISNGGIINFRDNSGNFVDPGFIPGTAHSGINEGGWINDAFGSAPVAVTSLIACNTQTAGVRAMVNNATASTFNSIVAGGGANIVPVFCDGTNWRIG